MSVSSKSPLRVARRALVLGSEELAPYAHRFSPKVYTQPQLFACLVLKAFFKTDYRGIAQLLRDCSDLPDALGMRTVPHFTTLQKAARRLLRQPHARRLFRRTVRRYFGRRRRPRVAFDASGLEGGHAGRYFIRRRTRKGSPWRTVTYTRYAKQAVAMFRLFRGITVSEAAVDTPDHRSFLQAALMSAVEGSAAMGFIEALFRSAYKPNATIKGIIFALGKAALRHYYRRPPTDLEHLKLYVNVVNDVSWSHRPYFDEIAQEIEY